MVFKRLLPLPACPPEHPERPGRSGRPALSDAAGASQAGEPADAEPDEGDALVGVALSADRMALAVSCHTPARGRGRPVDGPALRRAARRAGVSAELDLRAVERAVELLASGGDPRGVVLARGVKPVAARDAMLEALVDLGRPVTPGMAFARLHPAREARPGRDLTGAPLAPPEAPAPLDLAPGPGAGCRLGADGVLVAEVAGMVRVADGAVRVAPLLEISEDRLRVEATLHGFDAAGARMTLSRVEQELERLGVVQGIDLDAATRALEDAWATGRAVPGVVLASGRAPRHGENERLEMLLEGRNALGRLDSQGRLDYRERGFSPVVEAGQEIARLHPPTPGEPGVDVFGAEVPARHGRPLGLRLGRGVEPDPGDGALLRATLTGVVLHLRNLLEISDLLVIPGNVDLATGHVRVRQGSVHVRGGVGSGFAVQAPHSVLVDGTVEDAAISCGGDLVVRGGIAMSGEGPAPGAEGPGLVVGGSVRALFAQNARITAGGDVLVARYIAHSNVHAGFMVRAGGMVRLADTGGRIMGGTVVAGRGIEAGEAGSVMGVATVLVLSQDAPEAKPLVDEKRALKRRLAQIDAGLAKLTPERIAALTPARRRTLDQAVEMRQALRARVDALGRALAELARTLIETVEAARITVRGTVHPGVVIKMGGAALRLEEPMQGVAFTWSRRTRSIKVLR